MYKIIVIGNYNFDVNTYCELRSLLKLFDFRIKYLTMVNKKTG